MWKQLQVALDWLGRVQTVIWITAVITGAAVAGIVETLSVTPLWALVLLFLAATLVVIGGVIGWQNHRNSSSQRSSHLTIQKASLFASSLPPNSQSNTIREAGRKFRAAFTPAIAFLDKGRRHGSDHDRPDASAFLRNAFEFYAAAIEEFRHFVAPESREFYQNAWNGLLPVKY